MEQIKEYIKKNNFSLFKTDSSDKLSAQFDSRGFHFSEDANTFYNTIKNYPHLYVAFGNNSFYIGKSFQSGGRWKRSHYYHLGIMAHEILKTSKTDDQYHGHWVDAWMFRETFTIQSHGYSITLKQDIRISFIPFSLYSNKDFKTLSKNEIQAINKSKEKQLIESYGDDDIDLLNIQNRK